MKVAALVLGILGSLAIILLGAVWVSDFNDHAKMIDTMQQVSAASGPDSEVSKALDHQIKRKNSGYAMIILGIVSLIASAMTFKLGKISGAIMIASVLIPTFINPEAIIFGFVLLLAGILGLFIKPKIA